MGPGRILKEYEANKLKLKTLFERGALWASVNQSNQGVHGPLFEFVILADSLPDAGLEMK